MGLFVNTNTAALNAQRNLLFSTSKLSKSFQRLSSGLRINTAGDDAAGLSISERFSSQIRGLNQSVRNANDAISLVQVAEGALQESTAILQRIRELAVQAASDVNTEADREALQDEVGQLKAELERIGEATTFNQQKVLDGSFLDKKFHIGMNFRENIGVRVDDSRAKTLARHAVNTGLAVTTQAIASGDLLINGFTIRTTQSVDDAVSTTFGTGSAIAKATAINDATKFTGVSAYANETRRLGVAAIAGGTLDQTDFVTINGQTITGITVVEGDANNAFVEAINAVSAETGVIASIDRDGFVELTASDGRNIEVTASTLEAAQRTGLRAAAGADVQLATVTLHSTDQYQITGANEGYIGFTNDHIVGVTNVQAVEAIDVSSREGANLALLIADRAIAQISSNRSRLGAVQNRLESTINNLSTVSENASAARSRILDADFALETAQLSRNQILQQAATTVLAQANAQPQSALTLLQ
jgi:flagellin